MQHLIMTHGASIPAGD